MNRFLFILIFSLGLHSLAFSQQVNIRDPYKHFMEKVEHIDQTDTFKYIFHRIIYDFNNDGKPDIALSSQDSWGKAGGDWTLYFKQSKGTFSIAKIYYKKKNGKQGITDKVFFDPRTACIKKERSGTIRFITYHRMSCCEGTIVYCIIHKDRLQYYKSTEIGGPRKDQDVAVIMEKILNKGVRLKQEIAEINCLRKKQNGNCWKKG